MQSRIQIQLSQEPESRKGRSSQLSQSLVKFTSHKAFPPRLKFKAPCDNLKLWNFRRKQEFPSEKNKEVKTARELREEIPGPGYYEIEPRQRHTHGLITKEPTHKLLSTVDSVGPGPGFYNIVTVWKGREYKPSFNSLKLQQLFEQINQVTPGPGDYQQQIGSKPITSKYRSVSTCVISKTAKPQDSKFLTPGPGTYIKEERPKAKKPSIKFLHRYMV